MDQVSQAQIFNAIETDLGKNFVALVNRTDSS